MRITEVAKLFAGSVVVYFVVAACGAYSEGDNAASSSGGSSSGNASSSSGTSVVDPVGNVLAEGHKSGTRLKLRFYEGSDGSRQFIDFYDSELKTTCVVPSRTADGKDRCVPSQSGTPYYSTAACTGAPTLYAVPKTSPQPTVLVVRAVNSTPLTAYASGGLVAAPATVYQGGDQGTGGGCAETSSSPSTFNYYAVGAPLADTAFVEMTIKTE
jgi:hypothetical protein